MTSPLPPSELPRMIRTRPLPGGEIVIEANEVERAALAARFGLGAVESLMATIALEQRPRAIRATGRLAAAIMQPCAISGEDFPVAIEEAIDLRFVEENQQPAAEAEEIELEADDCDEIAYSGEMFDLGEAVAQTLGLAIDPYAKGPDADSARAAAGIVPEDAVRGPLADLLEGLKKD